MSDANRSETDTEAPSGWPTTRFLPGADTGLIGRRTIGLIETTSVTTRDRLWALVDADAAVDDILDELASKGLKSLPSFGLAETDGDIVRVVARGRVSILAERVGGDERGIDPSDVRTWTEEALTDVSSVTMRIGGAGTGLEAADGTGAGGTGAGGTEAGDTEAGGTGDEPFFVLAGIVPAVALVRRYRDVSAVSARDDVPAVLAPSRPTVEVAAVAPSRDAAVDVAVPDNDRPDNERTAAEDAASALDTSESEAVEPAPAESGRSGGSAGSGVSAGSAEAQSPFGDEADEPILAGSAPSTVAGRDLSGWAERPVLGVLAFSNGERIPVDGSVLIGRNPKFRGESDGAPLPRIMKFDGPNQGLSRTHAEVRIEGSDIVLEDLHSTNGTEIRLPGQQPERVEGGAPIVIVPGAQIDFGDELFCTLETADA